MSEQTRDGGGIVQMVTVLERAQNRTTALMDECHSDREADRRRMPQGVFSSLWITLEKIRGDIIRARQEAGEI